MINDSILSRKMGFYEKYIKRILDILCAAAAIIVFSWLYIIIAVLVRINLGSPVIFKQPRPGLIDPKTGKEHIFYLYKFRTMTDARDKNGKLLSDEERLGTFGKKLRATSLDELPEAFNIIKGEMSIVGPRPQLVRDMVFMTPEQRMRHTAKPGLSGLAQIKGRNAIKWEDKFFWDLKYIENVSLLNDIMIIFVTVKKVFLRTNMTDSSDEIELTCDYGDSLLKNGQISREEYETKLNKATDIINERSGYGNH